MKHAKAEALDALEPFLVQLRKLDALRERNQGTFYRKSRAFLHFHEDLAGLFADVRLDAEFERYRVSTKAEQRTLLARIRRALRG